MSWLRKLYRVLHRPAAPEEPIPLFWHDSDLGIFVRPKSQPRWDYVSMSGPYRTLRCDDDNEATVRYARVHESLAEATYRFATVNHPRVGEVCFLADGQDQAVLAWWDTHKGSQDLRFRWVGTRQAFDMLAVVDPVNAALWERLAYQEVLQQ